MYKVTFQGYTRDKKGNITWYKPFNEIHKSESDANLRAMALNWVIVSIEEIA